MVRHAVRLIIHPWSQCVHDQGVGDGSAVAYRDEAAGCVGLKLTASSGVKVHAMKRTISFLNGAFVGALAGALLALLLTPKSGQDLRDAIKREVDDIMTEGRRAAEQRQRELEAQLQQLWES
jgi:hypothetical protein